MLSDNAYVNTTVIVSTVGVVLAVAMITNWWQKKRRERVRVPNKWRRIGELCELSIYPLKSGAALPLNEAECTSVGVQTIDDIAVKLRDRFFIVITDGGAMRTARQHPKLYFIKVSPGDVGKVIFKAPGMEDLIFRIPTDPPKKRNVFTMWFDEKVESADCGDEAADWMHSFLGLKETDKIRLGFYQQEFLSKRDFSKKPWNSFRKVYRNLLRYDSGAFSDLAPYMIINEASVMDLNKRIPTGTVVAPSWFRPNFVVRGPEPLAEDDWNFVKIGDSAIFQYIKPCTRCIMTTMNPETAVKDPQMQPLETLRGYRLVQDPKLKPLEGDMPAMGCYVGLRQEGTVRVGDSVYVEAREG